MPIYWITLTGDELDNLICGLWAQISDYCCSREEEKPYRALIDRLEELRG